MYLKLPAKIVGSLRGARRLDAIINHIRAQVESAPFVLDAERLERLPTEVQTVYWLWCFICEAGGNGIEYFLLEQQGLYAREVHSALSRVGATELIRRLEAGIPHAIRACAEFRRLDDLAWFRQFKRQREYPTLQSVDSGVYPLINDNLRDLIDQFVDRHRDVFAAPQKPIRSRRVRGRKATGRKPLRNRSRGAA